MTGGPPASHVTDPGHAEEGNVQFPVPSWFRNRLTVCTFAAVGVIVRPVMLCEMVMSHTSAVAIEIVGVAVDQVADEAVSPLPPEPFAAAVSRPSAATVMFAAV